MNYNFYNYSAKVKNSQFSIFTISHLMLVFEVKSDDKLIKCRLYHCKIFKITKLLSLNNFFFNEKHGYFENFKGIR
jgi:hypothetical protein